MLLCHTEQLAFCVLRPTFLMLLKGGKLCSLVLGKAPYPCAPSLLVIASLCKLHAHMEKNDAQPNQPVVVFWVSFLKLPWKF